MKPIHDVPDLATITGHFHAKRALEVAACGGHSLALIGGPGNGKTLLARALPGLVPPCEDAQARPIVEGQEAMAWVEEALQGHTGCLNRARHGVLVLDRLDCFGYSPLQIQRLGTVLDRVRDVQLLLTLQPCPCGCYGDPLRECLCTTRLIERHQWRMRALLERVAIAVDIPRLDYEQQASERAQESSARVAERVRDGAARQRRRFAGLALTRNAEMDHAQVLQWCELDVSAQKLYRAAYQQLCFSGRTADNVLAVARTIADLAGSEHVLANHVAEAIQYQPRPSAR
jgi:magnesium chelatase family protein